MKPGIDLVSVFEKKQDENGGEYYIGTLESNLFKKAKGEIQVVLLKGETLPSSLVGNTNDSKESLYMFSQEKPADL